MGRHGTYMGCHRTYMGRHGTYMGCHGTYMGRHGTYMGCHGTYMGRHDTYMGCHGTYMGRHGTYNSGSTYCKLMCLFCLKIPVQQALHYSTSHSSSTTNTVIRKKEMVTKTRKSLFLFSYKEN
jgi:hypothetical protein